MRAERRNNRGDVGRQSCARKLYALALSCQMGIKSVDYVLKRYVPETISDPYWAAKVLELQAHLVDSAWEHLNPSGGSEEIQ